MEQNSISHLFITDRRKTISGVLKSSSIVPLQKYSPVVLLRAIQDAETPEDIARQREILPYLVAGLVSSGANSRYVNHLTTIVADTLLQKLIEFGLRELGLPPVPFCFLVFGSEGRREQTLRTDQDNAIVYEDVPPEMEEPVHGYFLDLGKKVCCWLDQAGYAYCDGDNMAQNPAWCRPLAAWKKYFTSWVSAGSAEDLLQTKIFFDFRSAYGEHDLAVQLRVHLNGLVSQHPRFFQLLARNVLQLTPPLGFFGNFVVESVGGRGKAFDIKSSMIPIVDYARIYALQEKIEETNTLDRLEQLHQRGVLSLQNYNEMVQAYGYLMQIRLQAQAEAVSRGSRKPDNYISPASLSSIEQKLLKEIFTQTKNFQSRLSYDFTGRLGGL
jgi:CBS domain-containing protein